MSEARVNKACPQRVWYHVPSNRLGYTIHNPFWGVIWFYAEHSETEVLRSNFAIFVDDERNPTTLDSADYIDLGVL